MLKRFIRPGLVLIIGIVLMIASNPSEEKFLNKVSMEYGAIHGGMHFTPAQLLKMGTSQRQSYLIFSTYEYQFGSIGVRYVGFLFSVFHLGSYREEKNFEKNEDVIARVK